MLDKSPDGKPSHFVLGEVLEGKKQFAHNVPEVKETGKYVAFDARDLVCPVSLLHVVSKNRNGSETISPWKKVIRKGPIFPKDMSKSVGDVATLFPVK